MPQRIATATVSLAHVLGRLGDKARDVVNSLANRLGLDPMLLVVRRLNRTAARGLINRLAHRIGHRVRIHNDLAVRIARGAADRLNKRAPVAQEALLVRVENGHERHFRQVKTLAE